MDVGSNERDHPDSSPLNNLRQQENSMDASYQAKFNMFAGGHRLDRPFDEKTHARRPSDEGERILRKISGAGMPPSFDGIGGVSNPRHLSYASDTSNDLDMVHSNALSLTDTGKMISNALSDSFLPSVGIDDPSTLQQVFSPQSNPVSMDFSASADFRRPSAGYTCDSAHQLFPTLTQHDRHPSAPLLQSMLTSAVHPTVTPPAPIPIPSTANNTNVLSPGDNKDVLMPDGNSDIDYIGQRVRSSSMPSRGLRLPPQISISSPDDLFSPFDGGPVSVGEPTSSNDGYPYQDYHPQSPSNDIAAIQKLLVQSQNLPLDPREWTETHVMQWAQWISKERQLPINIRLFQGITGSQLCSFTLQQFHNLANDYGNHLHSFIEMLKMACPQQKHHSGQQQTNPYGNFSSFPNTDFFSEGLLYSTDAPTITGSSGTTLSTSLNTTEGLMNFSNNGGGGAHLLPPPPPYRPGSPSGSDVSSPYTSPAPSPGPSPLHSPLPSPSYSPTSSPCVSPSPIRPASNTGPIQLWQFLLELLTDRDCQNCIAWTGREWEFKLIDPEEVARRWGSRKNKPKMNYEKLSRGLRYYYDKNIIHKVPGKRYVYRFVCDVESMLGMSYGELQQQLKGDGCEVSRPIKIERHRTASPMGGASMNSGMIPAPGGAATFPYHYPTGTTPDMSNLYINPSSPYMVSPLSTSPVNLGGVGGTNAYMQ